MKRPHMAPVIHDRNIRDIILQRGTEKEFKARELFEHRPFEGVVFMYKQFEKIAPLIGLVPQILFCMIPGAGRGQQRWDTPPN